MAFVVFVTPFLSENAQRFLAALIQTPEARCALISQDPLETLPAPARAGVLGYARVADALNASQVIAAARDLLRSHGPIDGLIGAMEQVQVPLAEARAQLGIPGMNVATAQNFRDKARMKHAFATHGVPCARFLGISHPDEAWRFASAVGYPLVIKPLDGAATQATFKCEHADALRAALGVIAPAPAKPAIIEEFITGDEASLETVTLHGAHLWHSLTHYLPNPLDCMHNPWVQWRVVLPREADAPGYDDIRAAARRALDVLGMHTGLSHLEWFRRKDGSLAISEVAARPPGAQITTLIARSCDTDFLVLWAELMVHGRFTPPVRRYASGAAFLRGQGRPDGAVKAVRGWEGLAAELGDIITDVRLPQPGQPKSISYEGEGYVIVRHPETRVVQQALQRIVETVRVEIG